MSKQQNLRPSFKYIKIKCIGIHVHACTHSKNTSSHTCCTGFVFVYSIYDGCTLTCPKTKQEDNLCIHTTIIDYTKAILFRNYWSYDYHFLSMKKKKKKTLQEGTACHTRSQRSQKTFCIHPIFGMNIFV